MKLPEGKKERTQLFVAIGLGALAILAGLYYGIGWLVSEKNDLLTKTEDCREKLRKANMEIDMMSKDHKANAEALKKIVDLSDKYLLKPRLGGSYILSAKELIESWAEKGGMMTTEADLQIREMGVGDVVQTPGATTVPPVKAYTAHVSFNAGYNQTIHFIKEIEQSNPLLAVLNVSFQAHAPPDVERHSVTFDIQWPIWSDPDMPEKLHAQLAAGEGTEKRGANEKK